MSEEMNVQQTEAELAMSQASVLKKGDIVTGKIVKVEDNQALVDVGYKYDGIIPLKELSSVGIDTATNAVEVGQEVQVKVIGINDAKEELTLSKRAIDSEKAWETLNTQLEDKSIIEAKVAEVVKGGLVVDIGVRGFVPASMVERHFVEDFSDYKGRSLRLRVKEIDREKNKVILSQKDILDEEYEVKKKEIIESIQVGQLFEGTVQRLTQFGAFIDIGGIDGLVHISEMAWNHIAHPSEVVKEGDKVKVQVLKVEPEKDKVSLSIKATQAGPWDTAESQFNVGDIVTGTVKRLATFGAFVEIAPGVEGLVHISQIAHRHIGTPHEILKEGQEVQAKILDLNAAEKRVSLSIKETEEAPEVEAKPERTERAPRGDRGNNNAHLKDIENNENVTMNKQSMTTTLGDRFGDLLSKFKQ
ncbi:30S ribosomal protein S1 [Paenibacillus sp. N1-5-1-14]|uniref:30S ribosomal protein S1 n=1 Tax=Paenibacillus radicibacter TaxID=2972488 RepID=UPI0021592DD8|nr:30S ribosomal protein S1 [Paenibacillus radicibacter]MCR8642315.1 30S ribosomal protein S1 [Paenibacillus radicibacter]